MSPAKTSREGREVTTLNTRDQRIRRLQIAASLKHENAVSKARRALLEMDSRGEVVNFRSVAIRASVSKDFLYSQPDLRKIIEQRRSSSGRDVRVVPESEKLSSAGSKVQLEVIKASNRKLRSEVESLRTENACLRGELLDLRRRGITTERT